MAKTEIQFSSFNDLLSALQPGQTLIIAPGVGAESRFLLPPFVRSTGSLTKVMFVGAPFLTADFPSGAVLCDVAGVKTTVALLERVKRSIKTHSRHKTIIVDGDVLFSIEGKSERHRVQLTGSFIALARKRNLRCLWLLPREAVSSKGLATLKDQADFFLHVERQGSDFLTRLSTAKGYYLNPFASPGVLSVAGDGIVIGTEKVDAKSGTKDNLVERAFESSSTALAIIEPDGPFRAFNQKAISLLGYPLEELHVLPLSELLVPGRKVGVLRLLLQLRRRKKTSGEGSIRRRDGRIVDIAVHASELEQGRVLLALTDIAPVRKHERQLHDDLDLSKVLSDANPVALLGGRKVTHTNSAFSQAFSWLKQKGFSITDLLGRPNSGVAKDIAGVAENPQGQSPPFRATVGIVGPEGQWRSFDITAVPIQMANKVVVRCSFVDVTERESVLAKLRDSEQYFRTIVEDSAEAVSFVRERKIVYANKRFAELFGFATPEEVLGKEASGYGSEADESDGKRKRKRAASNGAVKVVEYEFLRKDGTRITVEAQVSRITLGGVPTEVLYHRNITERKKTEQELRERARSLALVDEITRSIHAATELQEVLKRMLASTIKGLSQEFGAVYLVPQGSDELTITLQQGLTERLITTLAVQSRAEGVTGFVMKTHEPLILTPADYPPHLPYRSLFEAEHLTSVLYLPLVADESVVAILMLGSRKPRPLTISQEGILHALRDQLGGAVNNARKFHTLAEAEERYRSSVENISDVVYNASISGRFQFVSPNVERLLGYTPEEFYRSPDLWRMVLHPDDRTKYSQRISNQDRDVEDFHIEYRVLPKGKASYRWVRDSIRYRKDPSGEIVSINGIVSDITDRVDLEAALIKSEGLKTNILESVQEGVMVLDPSMTYIDWNSSMEQLTGIQRDHVIGRSAFEATPQMLGEELTALLNRALKGEAVSSEDIPFPGVGVEAQRYFWIRYSPLRDNAGVIRGVVGVLTDFTSRKRLERELRESEETLRNVIDAMGDALMISDLQGRVWEVNKEFTAVTGYSRSEVLGLDFPYPWVLDEEMAKFVRWIAELREKSYLRDFDMTWRRIDGRMIAISLNTTMLRNALGEPVAMLNIARDISERQRLSIELERKNRQIELLNRIISKANKTLDFGEIFDIIAAEVLALIPYDQINVGLVSDDRRSIVIHSCFSPSGKNLPRGTSVPIEETVSRLAIEKGTPVVLDDLQDVSGLSPEAWSIKEGLRSQICIPLFLHERLIGTFNIASVERQAFTGEELQVLQGIADQIGAMVDRARLFQKVSDDSKYIHNLVNSIESVVFTVDENYRITEANRAWREFAAMQGLELFSDENAIIGRPLAELTRDRHLLETYTAVMPDLFLGKLDVFSREIDLRKGSEVVTYHLAITPMIINERVTGLVFTLTDITDLKRNEEQLEQRNKELIALNAISTSISTSLELDAVLSVATLQTQEITGADMVLFYLRDEQRGNLVLAHSLGLDDAAVGKLSVLPTSGSATGTVVIRRQPLYIEENAFSDDRLYPQGREVFRTLCINSLGAIPLQSKDHVLGAMDVAFRTRHEFSGQEQQLLLLISNQIGAAIENAQLYAEVQAQVQRITSLYELGKSLTGAMDTTTLIHAVATEVCKALPIEHFTYYTFLPHHHSVVATYERTADSGRPVESGAALPETLVAEDSPLWEVVNKGLAVRENHFTGGSFLAVPVKSKEHVIGIIHVSTSYAGAYSNAHLRLLESIANLSEIAVERARLYEDTIAKSQEIEARNKELDDFTYVVSHDLKEPLISIEGYSKILLKDYDAKIDEEGREYLSSVVHSTARMKSLIDDLLTLSRLGRVTEQLQTVSADQLLKEILHELRFMLQEKHVQVEVVGQLPDVKYNATQLGMVFRNLLSNAVKFNNKAEPRVVISVHGREEEYQFSVADNGIGIDGKYYDKVFMIFQRLQRNEEYRGTGAGLTIVKKIVEKHQGRVWIESVVGEGTTFHFTVPR